MPSLTATNRLEWLQRKREAEVSEAAAISERCVADDRDLTDEENAAVARRREAVERLDREISVEVDTAERQGQYEQMAARIEPQLTRARTYTTLHIPHEQEPEMLYRSAGEYIRDYLTSRKDADADAAGRLERYRTQLTRANQVLDSNPGIVPTPALGPVIDTINARRPAIDAATRRPMPSGGRSFTRPIVTQHTAVGVQATEKTALVSQPLLINELEVLKATYGGTVNLSWQNRDWTEPAILDLIVSDLAAAYAQATDKAFCDALVAAVTQSVTASTGATPATATAATWLTAVYEAASLVFAAGNALPTVLWASPDVWAQLGALVDGSGRPMFPAVAPQNAMGNIGPGTFDANVAGFRLAVDANFPAGTAVLGDSAAVEFFETVGGTVSALEPTILGTAVAYYGYAATAVVRPDSLVSITTA